MNKGKILSYAMVLLILANLIVFSPKEVHAVGFSWNTQAYWGGYLPRDVGKPLTNVVEVHASTSIEQTLIGGGNTPDPCDDLYQNSGTLTVEITRVSGGPLWFAWGRGNWYVSARTVCSTNPGGVVEVGSYTEQSNTPDKIRFVATVGGKSGKIDTSEGFLGGYQIVQINFNSWASQHVYFYHIGDTCGSQGGVTLCWGSPISSSESEWGHSYVSTYIWNTQSFWGGSTNNVVQVCGKATLNKLDTGSFFTVDLTIERIAGANLIIHVWSISATTSLQELNMEIGSIDAILYHSVTPQKIEIKFNTPPTKTSIPPENYTIGILYGSDSWGHSFFYHTDYTQKTYTLPTTQSRNPSPACNKPPCSLSVFVSTDRSEYNVGENATITVKVTNNDAPVEGANLVDNGSTDPNGNPLNLTFGTTDANGEAKISLTPQLEGTYTIKIKASKEGCGDGVGEGGFSVVCLQLNVSVFASPSVAKIGETATFILNAQNEKEEPVLGLTINAMLTLPDGSTTSLSWTDNGDGTYTATYVPTISGVYKLDVVVSGVGYCETSASTEFEARKPLPDLVVRPEDIVVKINDINTSPTDIKLGTKTIIEVTVHNEGDADAGSFIVRVIVILEGIKEETYDIAIGGLKAGESVTSSVEWMPKHSGEYVIMVIVDPPTAEAI